MEDKTLEEKRRHDFLKLFCYIVTSARGLLEEPQTYGPLRLLDCVSRLITLLDNKGLADEFLKKELLKIDDSKYLVMQDLERFTAFLDEVVIDFTAELKRQRGQQ